MFKIFEFSQICCEIFNQNSISLAIAARTVSEPPQRSAIINCHCLGLWFTACTNSSILVWVLQTCAVNNSGRVDVKRF